MKFLETFSLILSGSIFFIFIAGIFNEALQYIYDGWFHVNGLYGILAGTLILSIPYIVFYGGEIINGIKRHIH